MARESLAHKRERALQVITTLIEAQPHAHCTLDYASPWQLLFAAILAAQCTDERVNKITKPMFEAWPDLECYAEASQEEVEAWVKSAGLYRNKAKAIRGSAQMLLSDYGGKVPSDLADLLKLPGVGRKIANLIQGEIFAYPALVVDTHCGRIARLLGFSQAKDPVKVEQDLCKIVPQDYWVVWGHHMVELGRQQCKARCRQCGLCPVAPLCSYGLGQAEAIAQARNEGKEDACF